VCEATACGDILWTTSASLRATPPCCMLKTLCRLADLRWCHGDTSRATGWPHRTQLGGTGGAALRIIATLTLVRLKIGDLTGLFYRAIHWVVPPNTCPEWYTHNDYWIILITLSRPSQRPSSAFQLCPGFPFVHMPFKSPVSRLHCRWADIVSYLRPRVCQRV